MEKFQNINKKLIKDSNEEIDKLFTNMETVEAKMFSCLKYQYYRYFVTLSNNIRIWTISNLKPSNLIKVYTGNNMQKTAKIDSNKTPILLLHGYLGSATFWICNLDDFTDTSREIYAIDLPGFSRSTRVHFGNNPVEYEKNILSIINEYINLLKIEKIILIGHSMGAFLSSGYTLNYPEKVETLILAEPWGYEDIKEEIVLGLTKCSWSTILKEVVYWKHHFRFIGLIIYPYSYFSLFRTFGEKFAVNTLSIVCPSFAKYYKYIWSNIIDSKIIYHHLYHINSCKYNTGEGIMNIFCTLVGWCNYPMFTRMLTLKSSSKIMFLYGEESWILKDPGFNLKRERPDLDVEVKIIEKAGHQIYSQQPTAFYDSIKQLF